MKYYCSGRDLNPSFGLERAASLTGLDDEKSEEFLPAIFKHLNYFSSRIEPAFSLSISKFKFISASGSLLFGFEPVKKANSYSVERL